MTTVDILDQPGYTPPPDTEISRALGVFSISDPLILKDKIIGYKMQIIFYL